MICREIEKPANLAQPEDELAIPALVLNMYGLGGADPNTVPPTFLEQSRDQLFGGEDTKVYAVSERPNESLLAIAKLSRSPVPTTAWLSRFIVLQDIPGDKLRPIEVMEFTIRHLASVARGRHFTGITALVEYHEIKQYEQLGFTEIGSPTPLRDMLLTL